MEIIRRASFSVVTLIFKLFSFGVFVILDAFEVICLKCQRLTGDEDNKFNFALAFPNGQHEKVVVDGNHSTEPKRIKLVLDIKMLPDHKYELVSAWNINSHRSNKWRPLDRIIETIVYYVLQVIKKIREILEETDRFLEVSRSRASCNGAHADTENRKMISPRKRVSKSSSRNFRRYISNIRKILGFGKPEGIVFDPIEGVADISLNGSMNNSKLKAAEKRKQPAYTTSESESTDNEEQDHSSQDTSEQAKWSKEEQKDEVSSTEATTTANDSALEGDGVFADAEGGCRKNEHQGLKKKDYFEVDEDYKSAEDPDYVPSQHESTSDDSEVDDEPKQKLLEEIVTQSLNLPLYPN
ncbi:unnamed protein product [Allacma fusca]|uniref:Uncharacterized protein n=1 Tax=Allacma fusca TaxID=39272 RepID=A0A8J2KK93_9HEXA|nr:unnamed protein product [Allacma fusca]